MINFPIFYNLFLDLKEFLPPFLKEVDTYNKDTIPMESNEYLANQITYEKEKTTAEELAIIIVTNIHRLSRLSEAFPKTTVRKPCVNPN